MVRHLYALYDDVGCKTSLGNILGDNLVVRYLSPADARRFTRPAAADGNKVIMSVINERIAIIGLGYVGLPVAIAFAEHCPQVIGFDISAHRIESLRDGQDWTGEIQSDVLRQSSLRVSNDPCDIAGSSFFVVTVPTPVDREHRPDLAPLRAACRTIGPCLQPGAVVVFESTVFPGATEEICGPELERSSGLVCGRDFKLAYSPERINPGDSVHTLSSIVKVVAGQDASTLARVAAAYRSIVRAGVYEAASIKVAEAAKVIENTQRDINIALMNELAVIFERLGLRTKDVLDAAATKWNFLNFVPGLVGGHCIGVDPYYLTAKAESVGYHPQVILAGRRINDGMSKFVAQKTIKLLIANGVELSRAKVGVLGLTFKENVPDLRNSKVPDILAELQSFGVKPQVHDPICDPLEAQQAFGVALEPIESLAQLDALILAVAHDPYCRDFEDLLAMIRPGGVLIDLKSLITPGQLRDDLTYWSL